MSPTNDNPQCQTCQGCGWDFTHERLCQCVGLRWAKSWLPKIMPAHLVDRDLWDLRTDHMPAPARREFQIVTRRLRAFSEKLAPGGKGLILVGACGVNKTGFLRAIVKDFAFHWPLQRIEYTTLVSMSARIRAGFNGEGEGEMDVLAPLLDAPLLVLDDIGSERGDWIGEKVFQILDAREDRVTLATSNLSLRELEGRWGMSGAKNCSRLEGLCSVIDMPAGVPDFRAARLAGN